MADFSTSGGVESRAEAFGAIEATSIGTVIASDATANTKGAYVELIASTGIDYNAMVLSIRDALNEQHLVDLAIGAIGSEVVIAPNLLVQPVGSASTTTRQLANVQLPIYIPKGTRISARCQCNVGTLAVLVSGIGYSAGIGGQRGRAKLVANGADTSDSGGTTVDSGGVINTKGSWVEMTSSASADYRELILGMGCGLNTGLATAGFLVDIGVGASGSEQVIVPNIWQYTASATDSLSIPFFSIPIQVAKGQRISVRMQSGVNTSPDDILDMVIYGVV